MFIVVRFAAAQLWLIWPSLLSSESLNHSSDTHEGIQKFRILGPVLVSHECSISGSTLGATRMNMSRAEFFSPLIRR